jgi:chemotaxis protein histidine kinase CheA
VGIWDWLKGNPEKKYQERFPERKKPSEAPAEEPEEPTPEPATEEKGEVAPEPQTSEPNEPAEQASEPSDETANKTADETPDETEKVEDVAPEAPEEKSEEQKPEPLPEEAPEPVVASVPEDMKELPPEPPAEKTAKPLPPPPKFGLPNPFKKQKPKTKAKAAEKESTAEPAFIKYLVLPLTIAAMILGMSIMPLFPQPLPAILAFLVAFLAYKKPVLGMPIGGMIIGLGLMYNLAKMDFISMLGSTGARQAVVFGFLFLFTVLPLFFRSRKAVISIDLGIIAAISLFFSQTYFLAIPLIFTSIVLFKKTSFLSVIYYVLLSVPMEIMQYLNLVMPIERWDWWIEPGTSPPIYVPLTQVFTNVQDSMLQFRLYDTSLVVNSISNQITAAPPDVPHTVSEIIGHYIDSFPGIIMFLFMVLGIVWAFAFLARMFFRTSNISHFERLLPTLTATVGVALFFILASALQGPLAFRVDITATQMTIATFATLLFTAPTLLLDYQPKERASVEMIREKAREIKDKLYVSEDEVAEVKRNLPISCGPFEVKLMMVSDRLNEILSKTTMRLDDSSEIDKIFSDLDSLSKDLDNIIAELDVAVGEYQVFVNCEYSKWVGMFKDIGIEPQVATVTAYQQAAPLKEKIEQIKEVLEAMRALANEIIKVAEQAYDVIRSFYDPTLPEENPSIAFAKKKLAEKVKPWIALDALFNAITNWSKHYRTQISKSVCHLQRSLAAIADLHVRNGRLQQVLGEDYPKMMENVKNAENLKRDIEKRALNAFNVIAIKDVFQSSLAIARSVLSILYEKLKSKEKAIELLSPSEEFLWEKNEALIKRMDVAMEMISKSSNVKLSEVLENLPTFLSYVDECVETIAVYRDMEELLLNYPVAEKTVENLLREKQSVSAKDLPFEPRYAEEYLKLFYSQKFREVSLDRTNMLLTKKK